MAIIKNPLIIVQSGGSGCYILITSVEGATLTCGSQTYTLGASETYHAFDVGSTGAFTCSASKTGYNTNTKTVTVSTVGVTEVTITPTITPSGYQQVEYLQSTGEQYLLTSFTVNGFDAFAGNIKCSSLPTSTYGVFGSSTSATSGGPNGKTLRAGTGGRMHWEIGINGNWATSDIPFVLNTKYTLSGVNKSGEQSLFVDGTRLLYQTKSVTLSNSYPIMIFAENHAGSATLLSAIILYNFSFSLNSADVLNLIPCYRISDSKPGMYDIVNSVFYTNQGSGADFVVGPDA